MQQTRDQLRERIRRVDDNSFAALALDVFRYQAAHNLIYARYLELLRVDPASVSRATEIPHLPIALFKRYALQSGTWEPV
ncbi:MAG: acyl transferase, partial [Bacteroidota bacterium]